MPQIRNSLLAIDPGTRHLGYAGFIGETLDDFGVRDLWYRRNGGDVFTAVTSVVTLLLDQKRPQAVVIEKNNFSQIRQNLQLTLVIGKIRHIARRHRIRVFELDPRTVRKVVCKDGNATKRELARTVTVRYPELRVYLESNRQWRERYFQNAFDAAACGMTFLAMSRTFTRPRNGR
ncbi:MAG: crossover junction endodeoxyribonuclease RuvC [candidate division Zixibacteria bacterium]|jgi:Holliday junction resolvasome RuvABC endonuclease subunit|nr:crossover junction endodeoxyribonuclease RuvC [candidate division Zixibacteria bacterium]